jgi:hypothetical protein
MIKSKKRYSRYLSNRERAVIYRETGMRAEFYNMDVRRIGSVCDIWKDRVFGFVSIGYRTMNRFNADNMFGGR